MHVPLRLGDNAENRQVSPGSGIKTPSHEKTSSFIRYLFDSKSRGDNHGETGLRRAKAVFNFQLLLGWELVTDVSALIALACFAIACYVMVRCFDVPNSASCC
jgi:hypothetical protein